MFGVQRSRLDEALAASAALRERTAQLEAENAALRESLLEASLRLGDGSREGASVVAVPDAEAEGAAGLAFAEAWTLPAAPGAGAVYRVAALGAARGGGGRALVATASFDGAVRVWAVVDGPGAGGPSGAASGQSSPASSAGGKKMPLSAKGAGKDEPWENEGRVMRPTAGAPCAALAAAGDGGLWAAA